MLVLLVVGIPTCAATITIILWGHLFKDDEYEIYDYTGETQPEER